MILKESCQATDSGLVVCVTCVKADKNNSASDCAMHVEISYPVQGLLVQICGFCFVNTVI